MYSTFQSHEPEFDYLKSLEIEEKINKIRWLKRKNPAHFLLSTNGEYEYIVPCGDGEDQVRCVTIVACQRPLRLELLIEKGAH